MNATATAAVITVAAAASKPTDMALAKAHAHAAAFHEAMAAALEAGDELAGDQDLEGRTYWQTAYAEALGKAAAALQKMPTKWAAILSAELPKQPVAETAA